MIYFIFPSNLYAQAQVIKVKFLQNCQKAHQKIFPPAYHWYWFNQSSNHWWLIRTWHKTIGITLRKCSARTDAYKMVFPESK